MKLKHVTVIMPKNIHAVKFIEQSLEENKPSKYGIRWISNTLYCNYLDTIKQLLNF